MNYTTIIIDDEPMGAETLRILLEKNCPEIKPVYTCCSPSQGIELIKQQKPAIVFLDIEMPVMNGFDVLNALKDEDFQCIFTTSYHQYALEAIKHNALDYLLKPVSESELKKALEKAKKRIDTGDDKFTKAIHNLLNNLQNQQQQNKFSISVGGEVFFVDLDEVLYFEADANYTNIYINNKNKIMSSKNLKKIEEGINMNDFMRIHNSYIINLKNVTRFNKGLTKKVIMKDGRELEISRSKINELVGRLEILFPNLF